MFFVVIGTVAILTYQRAKTTLLQPFRTEVFKAQLRELGDLLTFFAGKGEVELREAFAFERMLTVNAAALLDDYAWHFFDLKAEESKRPYNVKDCPTANLPAETLVVAVDPVEPLEKSEKEPRPDPRVRAATWAEYKYEVTRIPKEHSSAVSNVERMLGSPLLPKEIAHLVEEFLHLVKRNLVQVRESLTECANKLPGHYPNLDAMERASTHWVWNRYNDRFESLQPQADKIVEQVRAYYGTDSLEALGRRVEV